MPLAGLSQSDDVVPSVPGLRWHETLAGAITVDLGHVIQMLTARLLHNQVSLFFLPLEDILWRGTWKLQTSHPSANIVSGCMRWVTACYCHWF